MIISLLVNLKLRIMNQSNGYLILNKPAGLTSFKVLKQLQKLVPEIRKIGHAGTLDAFASGVLVCLCGSYTGLTPYFMAQDKSYRARIEFGKETDTLDPEGTVTKTGAVPEKHEVLAALEQFTGTIQQVPPQYSAVHVGGKRAYERALQEEHFTIDARSVTIYALTLEAWDPPFADILVHCSKGTYIRSLARDIGSYCGTCAYVKELERTAVGAFDYTQTCSLETVTGAAIRVLTPQSVQVLGLMPVILGARSQEAVRNGKPLATIPELASVIAEGTIAVFTREEKLLAIISKKNNRWSYEKVMAGVS